MPTHDELMRMLEDHVMYEYGSMMTIGGQVRPTQGTEWQNPVLESFLLHSRVLLDFFYAKPFNRKDSDVFAFHYVDGGEEKWDAVCPRDQARAIFGHEVTDLFNKISTSIGHLTTDRLDKAGWNELVLKGGLEATFASWIQHLTPEACAVLVAREERLREQFEGDGD